MVSTRALNVALQRNMILAVVQDVTCTISKGTLTCTMRLQPTPASRIYTVRLFYQPPKHPKITVLDPALELYPGAKRLPHVFAPDALCLYQAGDWDHDRSLASTIVPWTAEWLMFYEGWLAAGVWDGGGNPHQVSDR
ncbi:MAG TPA: hypothetical protein DGG94_05150 [Micromonosporaceae bacterium]|nr:hypothetical protein [Micromonosporaceae bacterium]HCU49186.1 hypothetical protein [Micromonosporaceae bacterium]